MKTFSKLDDNFICEKCGKNVEKLRYTSRDHCPFCLYSKHVDINPGDRANECKGLLKPIEIEKFKDRKTSKKENICDIEATIYCLRESHKGIIIGKGGNLLKKIASTARYDIEDMLGTKVNLKVWVKVKEDWQEKDNIVNKFKLK